MCIYYDFGRQRKFDYHFIWFIIFFASPAAFVRIDTRRIYADIFGVMGKLVCVRALGCLAVHMLIRLAIFSCFFPTALTHIHFSINLLMIIDFHLFLSSFFFVLFDSKQCCESHFFYCWDFNTRNIFGKRSSRIVLEITRFYHDG